MNYQLILQWSIADMSDFDDLVRIEEDIAAGISEVSDVDGHDSGANEVNIFVHTNDPLRAFGEISEKLGHSPEWATVRIAYRDFDSDEFKTLWPVGLKKFDVT